MSSYLFYLFKQQLRPLSVLVKCLLLMIMWVGFSNAHAQTESFSVKIEGESYTSMYGIQTESTSDTGGGLNVSYINNNDWMSYSGTAVNIPRTGAYKITYRVSSTYNTGVIQLRDANTNAQIDRQLIPNTAGWQAWTSVEKIVNLNQGIQAFTIYAETGNFNFNWFKIESIDQFPAVVSTQIEAEYYTTMQGIQIESTTDGAGGLAVGYIDSNDWISYSSNLVLLPRSETYKITYRVASLNGGGIIQLRDTNTGVQIDRFLVPQTNGWQVWETVERIINLNQGVQGFTVYAEVGKFNFNWFKIESIPQTGETLSAASSLSSNAASSQVSSIVVSSVTSSISVSSLPAASSIANSTLSSIVNSVTSSVQSSNFSSSPSSLAIVSSSSLIASSSVSSIEPSTLPALELVVPEVGGVDNYSLGQKVTLSARLVNAVGAQWKDAGGLVPKVSFYIDGYEKIGEVVGDGTKLEWTPPAQGIYVIHAEIVLSGYKVKSRTGALNIVQPAGHPKVVLSDGVKNGQIHPLGGPISIAAIASDDGTITKVGFYANNVLITEVPTTPNAYVYHDWVPTTAGLYKLVARAYDNAGNISTSKAVELFFVNPATQSSSSASSNSAPAVTITEPFTPAQYHDLGGSVWVSGQIRANNQQYYNSASSIPSIDFYANSVKVITGARGDGFGASWQPMAVGTYEIYSTVTLENSTVVKSPTAIAVVKKNGAPRVYLTSPQINNLLLSTGERLTLAADAADSDGGTIRALTFYVDIYDASGLNKIGSTSYPKNSAPYSVDVGPFAADAVFKVYVLAEDNSGLQSISSIKVIRYTGAAVNSSSSSSVARELEVELASPHQGAVDNYASGQVVPLSARLFNSSGALHKDTDGSFPKVTFIADDYETLAQSTADGSVANWTPPVSGVYTIKAIAELKNGTRFVSKVGSVNIAAPVGYPSVSFMNGVIRNGARYLTTNSGIGLAVDTSDNGSVTKVMFYANNQLLKEVLASSGAFVYHDWKPTVAGSYQLKAVAFDNSGNSTTSRTVEIFVDAPVTSSSSTSSSSFASVMKTWLDLGSPSSRLTGYHTLGSGYPYPLDATVKLEINGVSQAIYNRNGSKIQSEFYSNGVKLPTVNPQPVHTMQNWIPPAAGTYEITAQAQLENGDRLTSESGILVVSQAGAPRVNLTTPQNSRQSYYSGTAISVSASASDSDGGNITRVDFSINGTVISDTSAPYTASHFLGSPGTYEVFAMAYDNSGMSQKSVVRTINVIPVPRNASSSSSSVASNLAIELTAPLQGTVDNYQSGQSVSLSARIFDASGVLYKNPEDGSIVNVSFIADGYDVLLQSGNGFNSTWVPVVPGIYTIKAIAQLKNGTKLTSKVGSVNIYPLAGYPSVSFMSGVIRNGQRFLTTNSGIGLAVNASDDGSVAKVVYYANNQLITEVLASSGAFVYHDWKPTVAGSYKLKAVAFDNSGNSTTSRTVEIFVDAPGVSSSSTGSSSSAAAIKTWLDLDSPGPNGITGYYILNPNIPYQVDATAKLEINGVSQTIFNNNGSKIQSEFYGNGVKLPTVLREPAHTMHNWTPPSAGTYEITAQASLENGDKLVSNTGVLVVSQPGAPRVSLTSPENSKKIYYSGTEILLAASASDSDGGSITKVEFSLNGNVITDTTAPYTASYRAGVPGTYEVFVKAYDNSGLTQQTSVRTINVVSVPLNVSSASSSSAGSNGKFELTGPQQETVANYKLGEQVPLSAVLSDQNGAVFKDTDGTVAKVTFIADTYETLTTGTADGKVVSWVPSVPGVYTVKAIAELKNGVKFISKAGVINVARPNGYPNVNFDGMTIYSGQRSITNVPPYLMAYATDDGSVSKVSFYINEQLVKEFTPTGGIYMFMDYDWKPTIAGIYKFKAVAVDNNGNSTTSRTLQLFVDNPGSSSSSSAPAVRSWLDFNSNPPTKSTYFDRTSLYPLSFYAVAKLDIANGSSQELFNSNGSKIHSEFYGNGMKLPTVKYEPADNLMHAWTPASAGAYEVTAQAQLENGERLVSEAGMVIVTHKGAPRIAFAIPAYSGQRFKAELLGPFANVADSDGGTITKVSFYLSDVNQPLDDTKPATAVATTAPYQLWLDFAALGYGKYQIKAIAEDNSGLKTATGIREFIVEPSGPVTSSSSLASSNSSSPLIGSSSSSSLIGSNSSSSSSILGVGSTSSSSNSLSSLSSRSSSLPSSSSSAPNVRMVATGPYSGSGECTIDGNNLTCTGAAASNAPTTGSLVNPQWVSLSDTYACVLHKPSTQNVLLCWSGSKPLHQVTNLLDPITVAVTNEFGCAQRNPQEAYCWNQYNTVGATVAAQYQKPAVVTDRLCWVNTSRVLECVSNILAPDNGVEGETLPFTPIGLSVGGELEMFPYACAISDKRLVCKGDPFGINFSALIDYTIPPGSAYSFKQVSTGYNHVCTLQQTSLGQSRVECWNANGVLKTDTPALVKPTQVSSGNGRTCVADDGRKVCWQ